MYFNYHAKIKNKVKDGKLKSMHFENNYKNIGRALVLEFNDGTKFPIREYRFLEYFELIDEMYNTTQNSNNIICKPKI